MIVSLSSNISIYNVIFRNLELTGGETDPFFYFMDATYDYTFDQPYKLTASLYNCTFYNIISILNKEALILYSSAGMDFNFSYVTFELLQICKNISIYDRFTINLILS